MAAIGEDLLDSPVQTQGNAEGATMIPGKNDLVTATAFAQAASAPADNDGFNEDDNSPEDALMGGAPDDAKPATGEGLRDNDNGAGANRQSDADDGAFF